MKTLYFAFQHTNFKLLPKQFWFKSVKNKSVKLASENGVNLCFSLKFGNGTITDDHQLLGHFLPTNSNTI